MSTTSHSAAGPWLRLAAPKNHGRWLLWPPRADVPALLAENRRRLAAAPSVLGGRPLAELRAAARQAARDAAREYASRYLEHPPTEPELLLVAGHQPQLFHPGVWFKNFALGQLAERHGGLGLNLIVDNDTLKSVALPVPTGTLDAPRLEPVAFDAALPEMPYEERPIAEPGVVARFGSRAAEAIAPLVGDPLVRTAWAGFVERARRERLLGLALAQGRHLIERSWGARTYEVPLGALCGGDPFRWFACCLLSELPRFAEAYNAAVLEYRRAYHLRSAHHPVPLLAADEPWLEAPFWLWHVEDPRRRRLRVRRQGGRLELGDGAEVVAALDCGGVAATATAVGQLDALERQGWKLRPRALITTLYARLLLADLFLHGLGGALYDQVTDRIIERFFGVEPPSYLALTATLHLPIPRAADPAAQAAAARGQMRALRYHPERFLATGFSEEAAALCAEKRRWIETPQTRDNARQRAQALARINLALQASLTEQRDDAAARLARSTRAAAADLLLGSREYAFCLYPEKTLRNLLEMLAETS